MDRKPAAVACALSIAGVAMLCTPLGPRSGLSIVVQTSRCPDDRGDSTVLGAEITYSWFDWQLKLNAQTASCACCADDHTKTDLPAPETIGRTLLFELSYARVP